MNSVIYLAMQNNGQLSVCAHEYRQHLSASANTCFNRSEQFMFMQKSTARHPVNSSVQQLSFRLRLMLVACNGSCLSTFFFFFSFSHSFIFVSISLDFVLCLVHQNLREKQVRVTQTAGFILTIGSMHLNTVCYALFNQLALIL